MPSRIEPRTNDNDCSGIFPTTPLLTAWVGNNLSGSLKRGVGFGMVVGFANFGGIVAAFIYQSKDSPRYFFSTQLDPLALYEFTEQIY